MTECQPCDGRGWIEQPPKIDSMLKLLQQVNDLNMRSESGVTYWTCVVMYNTVVWRRDHTGHTEMFAIYTGILT